MKFIKKSPVTLELEKIEKEEKRLEQRALSHTEPGWKEALTARIPPKMSENLQKAFCMAFRTIFEKGNLLIEKTYRRDELEKDFKVRDFSLDLKESRKEYKKLRTEAARRNLKNQAVSAAEGLGLGLLGVGLPDIAIFTAMLLRGVYETALYFGFSYDTPEERFFILCLLEASVSRGGAVGREQRTGGQADLYAGPEERTDRIRRGSGGTDPGGGKRLCHRHASRQIYPGPSGGGSLRRPFQSGLLEAGHDLCAVKI